METDTWQDASSVVDTLGLRAICPEIALRVKERLPRLKRDDLLRHVGVDRLDEAVHVAHLVDAATAAFALDALLLRGEGARARAAAVVAAKGAVSTAEIAATLGVTVQSVTRLANAGAPPRDVRAVRLQMALRAGRPALPL